MTEKQLSIEVLSENEYNRLTKELLKQGYTYFGKDPAERAYITHDKFMIINFSPHAAKNNYIIGSSTSIGKVISIDSFIDGDCNDDLYEIRKWLYD